MSQRPFLREMIGDSRDPGLHGWVHIKRKGSRWFGPAVTSMTSSEASSSVSSTGILGRFAFGGETESLGMGSIRTRYVPVGAPSSGLIVVRATVPSAPTSLDG